MAPDGPLVGRKAEKLALHHALDALVRPGQALQGVLIEGDPGQGKTRLVRHLTGEAEKKERGYQVLPAEAAREERELPYRMIVVALRAALRDDLPPDLAAHVEGVISLLTSGLQADAGAQVGRHLAVADLLSALAADRPTLLILDDAHWADPATVQLIAYLLRRPPTGPVLLVVAARLGGVPQDLERAAGKAERKGHLQHFELGPLTLEDAAWLFPHLDQATLADYHERSGGVAFYLVELERAGGRVPATVEALLDDLTSELTESAHGLLNAAAVAGSRFTLDVAAAAAGLAREKIPPVLTEIMALRIFSEDPEAPGSYGWRQDLVYEVAYGRLPAGTRLTLHERVDNALADRGTPAGQRVHHVMRYAPATGQADLAAAVLQEAADETVALAPQTAIGWYATALELIPDRPERRPARRALLEALAQAHSAVGTHQASCDHFLELLRRTPAEETGERLRITRAVAAAEHRLGQHADADRRLHAALRRLPEHGVAAERAELHYALTLGAFMRADFEAMGVHGAAAYGHAASCDDHALAAAATAVRAFASAQAGDIPTASEHYPTALGLVDDLTDEEIIVRPDAGVHAMAASVSLDDFAAATALSERMFSLVRDAGQLQRWPLLTQASVYAQATAGQLEKAAALGDRAVDTADLADDRESYIWALAQRAWVALLAGNTTAALKGARKAVDEADDRHPSVITAYAGAVHGWALLESGHPVKAVTAITTACGGPDLPRLLAILRGTIQEVLVRAWIKRGDLDEARAAAVLAGKAATRLDNLSLPRLTAHRAAARCALAGGDPLSAVREGRAAADLARSITARIDEAHARVLIGRARQAAGDAAGAVEDLDQALAIYRSCEATGYRDDILAERESIGGPPPVPDDARNGPESPLTPTEWRVARLAADGKTSKQIGREMSVAESTIETHLGHIYFKIRAKGLSSPRLRLIKWYMKNKHLSTENS